MIMFNAGCKKFYILFFLLLLLFIKFHAYAVPDADLPEESVVIGIEPFLKTDTTVKDAQEAQFLVQSLSLILEGYGYKILHIPSKDKLADEMKFESETGDILPLDFLIRGVIFKSEESIISAQIFEHGKKTPRYIEGRGKKAFLSIRSLILKYISDHSSIASIIKRKKNDALRILKTNPDHFESLAILGLALKQENFIDSAINVLKKAVNINPDNAGAHYTLALCYDLKKDKINKLHHLLKANKIDPHNEAAGIALGNHYLRNGNTARAIAIYSKWLESERNAPIANWNIALAYRKNGELEKALGHLKEIEKSDYLFEQAQMLIPVMEQEQEKVKATQKEKRSKDLYVSRTLKIAGIGLLFLVAVLVTVRIIRNMKVENSSLSDQKVNIIIAVISALTSIITTILAIIYK